MELLTQILLGSLVLGLCAIIHVGMVAVGIPILIRAAALADARFPRLKSGFLIGFAFVWIVISHTIQIWLWAVVLFWMGAFQEIKTAIYFTVVTYTTVGYGDITLAEGVRNFASFSAITGVLSFGVSTAFLVALVGRIMPMAFENSPGIESRSNPETEAARRD